MAATFVVNTNKPKGDVIGSTRILAGVLTLDASSGNVSPGLNNIWNATATPKSAATGGFVCTFTNTSVTLASAASGDDFIITIWGS